MKIKKLIRSLSTDSESYTQQNVKSISQALKEVFSDNTKEIYKDYLEDIIEASCAGKIETISDLESEIMRAQAKRALSRKTALNFLVRQSSGPLSNEKRKSIGRRVYDKTEDRPWTIEFTPSFSKNLK